MTNIIIDVNLIDESGENPFEELMKIVEKASLEGKIGEEKSFIEKKILYLERQMQDLSDSESEVHKIIMDSTLKLMSEYTRICSNNEEYSKKGFAIAFKSIDKVSHILTSLDDNNEEETFDKISSLSVKKFLVEKDKKSTSWQEMIHIANINLVNHGIIYNEPVNTIPSYQLSGAKKNIPEWSIELNFNTKRNDHHKPLEFIHQFIEILNQIDGVTAVLEDIKIGSIKAKLKVIFDEIKSKDDVKELLESSRKFAKAKLEKEFEENENLKALTEKIDIERELLKEELKDKTSIESSYLRSLKIQEAEADLKRKQLENKMLNLKLIKESSETFAEMLALGYISQNDFEMLIQGIPFMSFKNGNLSIGESTDIIDEM